MRDFFVEKDEGTAATYFRYESFPEEVMSARAANEALVGDEVDFVPMDQVRGRMAAALALIHPPGIGIIVPDERYDNRAQPMIDYFLTLEESCNTFPGFSYEMQGVYQVREEGKSRF